MEFWWIDWFGFAAADGGGDWEATHEVICSRGHGAWTATSMVMAINSDGVEFPLYTAGEWGEGLASDLTFHLDYGLLFQGRPVSGQIRKVMTRRPA